MIKVNEVKTIKQTIITVPGQQVCNKSLWWNLGNDTTQQTQRTFARANLLQTCYGETGVMDFGLYKVPMWPTGWSKKVIPQF